ncbi:hypothetical protein LUZ60_010639 [Juncus effusus]|nr:hypothetical protein LUZ60_010639 [Juncus effusus]
MATVYDTTGRGANNYAVMLWLVGTILFDFIICSLSAGDTLFASEQIIDGGDLISAQGIFELGFFSPETQTTRYVGIWFRNMNTKRVVWVANRATPITAKNGSLILTKDGNLSLRDGNGTVVWSTGTTLTKNVQASLLDTGNFVLEDNVTGSLLWQSFDYPCDTLLPEMRLGYDLQINHERYISSWKSADDPTPGNYSYKLDPKRLPELLLLADTTVKYRSGPWTGVSFNGIPQVKTVLVYHVVSYQSSTYYWFDNTDSSVLWHLVIGSDGLMHRMFNSSGDWIEYWHYPQDNCDSYGYCGPYGKCTNNDCSCLTQSFSPKSNINWNLRNFSDGCVRNEPLNCTKDNGFIKMPSMKLPDTLYATVSNTSRVDECKSLCLMSCNCTAFAILGGNECVTWQGDLIDMVQFSGSGDDLYLRGSGSDSSSSGGSKKHSTLIIIIASAASVAAIAVSIVVFVLCYRHRRQTEPTLPQPDHEVIQVPLPKSDLSLDLETFDIKILRAATNNFRDNKIGEGCFGPVYKATLQGGAVIAVKRLAKDACKGHRQFVNEVNLLAKLSHRNLVQLLGYCIDDQERILCYEYMPNGSLDNFLDEPPRVRKSYLQSKFDWKIRSKILEEISCGILYLHDECGEKIVHRDLKPGNILLDEKMMPKISDFGFAKLCRKDQRSTYTAVFAGTMGYMAPEMLRWKVSPKADVYSFGIVIMEIVTGRLATSFSTGIINHVSRYWMEGKELELIDPRIKENANKEEIVRFIMISLLCVQEDKEKRPEMRNVNVMLNCVTTVLPYVPRNLFIGWGVSFDGPLRLNGSSTDYSDTPSPSTQPSTQSFSI